MFLSDIQRLWGAMCIKTKTLDSIYICCYVFTYCACVFTYVAMYLYIMLVYLYIPLCIYIPRLCISIVNMYLYSVLCIYIYGCVSIGTGYITHKVVFINIGMYLLISL